MSAGQHTPGPWRWKLNEAHKNLSLVGGKPQFDLTIIQPTRWGMSSATLFVRDTTHEGMNLLHKVHERRDWIRPFPGRSHHASWCAGVVHPDMQLIEAAPDLLAACKGLLERYHIMGCGDGIEARAASLAIAKATGGES